MNDYSLGDVDESTTNIETEEISQVKTVREYEISWQTLERKCKKKIENVSEKRPGLNPELGDQADKYLSQWALVMQKQGRPMGQDMIVHKYQ